MSLPNVSINFKNGSLGSVVPSADGVVGVVVGKSSLVGTEEAKVFYGSTAFAAEKDNPELLAFAKAFYANAGEGAELWVYNFGGPNQNSTSFETSIGYLVEKSGFRVRTVALCIDHTYTSLDEHLEAAQLFCDQVLEIYHLPVICLINVENCNSYDEFPNLTEKNYDRVAVCCSNDLGAIAGRIAASSVETHIGRVRDGALKLADRTYDDDAMQFLNNRGYITLRTYAGKDGYFFTDDHMACAETSDFHSLARRRVIDKAYRCAYTVLLEYVNDNLPVTSEGCITAMAAKAIEQEVAQYIYNSMTAEGNLSVDESDSTDMGVKVSVDTTNDFVATNRLNVTISVKPYGYAKYISVDLGFLKE